MHTDSRLRNHHDAKFDVLNIIKLSVIVFSSVAILIFSLQISKKSFSTQTSAQNTQQQLTTTLPPNTISDEQIKQLSEDPNFLQAFVQFVVNYLRGTNNQQTNTNTTTGQPSTPPAGSICTKAEGCGGDCQPNNNSGCGYGGCRFWEECADDNGDGVFSCHDRTNGQDYYKMNPKPQNVCFGKLGVQTQTPNNPPPSPTQTSTKGQRPPPSPSISPSTTQPSISPGQTNNNSSLPNAITNGMCDIPFMLASHHYNQSLGDIFYYYWHTEGSMGGQNVTDQAREQQLQKLLTEMKRIPDNTTEMLLMSSYRTVEHALQNHAQELKSAGIEWIGYNMEGPPVSTPSDELNNMYLQNENNSVARFARLVESYGFKSMWGPIGQKVHNAPDGGLYPMKEAGLDAVAIQEQKGIEGGDVAGRTAAVKVTTDRYRSIFGPGFGVFVQIMSVRCPSYDKCKQFTDNILSTNSMGRSGPVNGIAIWANRGGDQGSQLNGFMQKLCENRN